MLEELKTFLKTRLPFLVHLWRNITHWRLFTKRPDKIFSEIYFENKWGDNDSVSGPGSNLIETEAVRDALPLLIVELDCKVFLDIPCGDFFWMDVVKINVQYIGGDIVADLIRTNQTKYGRDDRNFVRLDIIAHSLPRVDLILCRDCLVHFSYSDIFKALANIKNSGSTFFLTTTFTERTRNDNIPTGAWRPINFQLAPFNFPPPIRLIDEKCLLNNFRDKNLGLWRIADIPDFQ